tara:strand:+ start:530 stop:1018 length:489 start_codon:yes stop_codon:yes gene_type:complete
MATSTRKKVQPKVPEKLPPNPFIHEILELASKQKSLANKVKILQEYACDPLKAVLIWNYDESLISLLPEGEVPYEKNDVPVGTDHTSLRREWKNLYHFVQGGNPTLSKTRRESMFIQMLEGLHPDEAEVLVLMKDKLLYNKYKVSKTVVERAFPDIIWGERS